MSAFRDSLPVRNARLDGLIKLRQAGLRVPDPIFVVTNEAFVDYKRHGGRFSNSVLLALTASFRQLMESKVGAGVAVRRAYYIPGIPNPPGPRSLVVRDFRGFVSNLRGIFDYAIQAEYDKEIEGEAAQIAAFAHPFIDPNPPEFGGSASVVRFRGKRLIIVIESLYGNDEGIFTFPHDDYWVNYKTLKFVGRAYNELPTLHKTICVRLGKGKKSQTAKVPSQLQDRKVMTEDQVKQLAQNVKRFREFYNSNYRLEFDWISTGLYFTECAAFDEKDFLRQYLIDPHENKLHLPPFPAKSIRDFLGLDKPGSHKRETIEGTVSVISSEKDINKRRLGKKGIIVFFSVQSNMVKDRLLRMTLTLVRALPQDAIILVPHSGVHPYDYLSLMAKRGRIRHLIITDGRQFKAGDRLRIMLDERGSPMRFERERRIRRIVEPPSVTVPSAH